MVKISHDGTEVQVQLADMLQILSFVQGFVGSAQAARRVDKLELEQAKELADRLELMIDEVHEQNRNL